MGMMTHGSSFSGMANNSLHREASKLHTQHVPNSCSVAARHRCSPGRWTTARRTRCDDVKGSRSEPFTVVALLQFWFILIIADDVESPWLFIHCRRCHAHTFHEIVQFFLFYIAWLISPATVSVLHKFQEIFHAVEFRNRIKTVMNKILRYKVSDNIQEKR